MKLQPLIKACKLATKRGLQIMATILNSNLAVRTYRNPEISTIHFLLDYNVAIQNRLHLFGIQNFIVARRIAATEP